MNAANLQIARTPRRRRTRTSARQVHRSSTLRVGRVHLPTFASIYAWATMKPSAHPTKLKQIADSAAPSTVFWQATAMNPRFQVTQESLGNGVIASSAFDAVTGRLASLQSGTGGGSGVQNEAYQPSDRSNFASTSDSDECPSGLSLQSR